MARLTRILSLDGGGVRALVPAQVAVALEAILRRLTGNPRTRLAEHFDLVAGASSGVLLACLYLVPGDDGAEPRHDAQHAVDLILARAPEIFRLSVWQRIRSLGGTIDERYAASGLEAAAREAFGDLRLSQLVRPCLFPAYDIERRRAYFFKQREARREPERDFAVRDVLRAVTAAPTYFEVTRIRSLAGTHHALIDGGVFANNPALTAFAEAHGLEPRPGAGAENMLHLSLGTGVVKRPYPYREARDWGLAEWIRPLIDIMMCGSSETVDYELAQIHEAAGRPDRYLRLQTELAGARPELDAASPENLEALRDLGRALADRHATELESFARLLLAGDGEAS